MASQDLSFEDMKAEFISMDQEIKEKVKNFLTFPHKVNFFFGINNIRLMSRAHF